MLLVDTMPGAPLRERLWAALCSFGWGLPNALVAVPAGAAAQLLGGRAERFQGAVVVRWPALRGIGAVCLGPVILMDDRQGRETLLHEWGHYRQHRLLGPLYYLIIGLPSVTHAIWFRYQEKPWYMYFHFYTEAWADALGGVYHLHQHRHRHWTGYLLRW